MSSLQNPWWAKFGFLCITLLFAFVLFVDLSRYWYVDYAFGLAMLSSLMLLRLGCQSVWPPTLSLLLFFLLLETRVWWAV